MAIQFLSRKDTRAKPHDIMWIHRKKNKRKSRLAKQKYNYSGFDPDNYTYRDSKNSPWITRQTSITQFPITHQGTPSWEQDGHVRKRFTDPQVYEGAYRRKPKRKIIWFRNKKQRKKNRLAKQKHNRTSRYYEPFPMNNIDLDAEMERENRATRKMRQAGQLASSGIDTVYRRKHPKKKQKKRNRTK
jgi:hypothetical protein